jgi:hypothetical protein
MMQNDANPRGRNGTFGSWFLEPDMGLIFPGLEEMGGLGSPKRPVFL